MIVPKPVLVPKLALALMVSAVLISITLTGCVASQPENSVESQHENCVESQPDNCVENSGLVNVDWGMMGVEHKPVIYLYPSEEADIEISIDGAQVTASYPEYDSGWTITASPDGTLCDSSGREYGYLFWEGDCVVRRIEGSGFCVAGSDTVPFLEWACAEHGLTDKEACDFISYWAPKMQESAYNAISFDTGTWELSSSYDFDTAICMNMVWKSLDEPIELTPQEIPHVERTGSVIVEWGGSIL